MKNVIILILALIAAAPGGAEDLVAEGETHLAEIRQLTFGGENAEAYWSPDGRELIFQARGGNTGFDCDQIFRVPIDGTGEPRRVSTGAGRTTCAYFAYPSADRIVYASTHDKGGDNCPPEPDRSQGYVWPLYPSYEIYSANPDGSDLIALSDNDAYDAEATVCPTDGSIIFTSDRDKDLELYRMDADGGNVVRLTSTPGYDGGAFYSADCSQIVWRASRPQEGEELDDFRTLLADHLVRPNKLEVFVAKADGSNVQAGDRAGSRLVCAFLSSLGRVGSCSPPTTARRVGGSSRSGLSTPAEAIWSGSPLARISMAFRCSPPTARCSRLLRTVIRASGAKPMCLWPAGSKTQQ